MGRTDYRREMASHMACAESAFNRDVGAASMGLVPAGLQIFVTRGTVPGPGSDSPRTMTVLAPLGRDNGDDRRMCRSRGDVRRQVAVTG
jgi:hypothetical protein